MLTRSACSVSPLAAGCSSSTRTAALKRTRRSSSRASSAHTAGKRETCGEYMRSGPAAHVAMVMARRAGSGVASPCFSCSSMPEFTSSSVSTRPKRILISSVVTPPLRAAAAPSPSSVAHVRSGRMKTVTIARSVSTYDSSVVISSRHAARSFLSAFDVGEGAAALSPLVWPWLALADMVRRG